MFIKQETGSDAWGIRNLSFLKAAMVGAWVTAGKTQLASVKTPKAVELVGLRCCGG